MYIFPKCLYFITLSKNVCVWFTSLLPHIRQDYCCEPVCLLFILGVIKYRVKFFHPNSLHFLEFVVVCCVSHILSHSSVVISVLSSFSHLALMYIVEEVAQFLSFFYNTEITFSLVPLYVCIITSITPLTVYI